MQSVTERAHELLRPHIRPGDIAIDGTAGNGHDTLFLAECVGPGGKVFAFDIQKIALERTATLLAGFRNVELIGASHSELKREIPAEFHGRIAVAMFNFGYIPNGDRSIRTRTATSVAALAAASELLRPGGWLSAILYTGHPGGAEEAGAAEALLRSLPFVWACETSDRANAPRVWVGQSP